MVAGPLRFKYVRFHFEKEDLSFLVIQMEDTARNTEA
jgi:hypothetical protein